MVLISTPGVAVVNSGPSLHLQKPNLNSQMPCGAKVTGTNALLIPWERDDEELDENDHVVTVIIGNGE